MPLASRLIGFSGLQLLSAFMPLAVLPIIARTGGAEVWIAVGVGQAIGSMAGLTGTLGWNIQGPQVMALAASQSERQRIYQAAFWSRSYATLASSSLASIVILYWPSGDESFVAILFCLSTALSGLSISWVAVGVGSPTLLAVFEVGPRAVGLAVGTLFSLWINWIPAIPLSLLFSSLSAILCFNHHFTGRAIPKPPAFRELRSVMTGHKSSTVLSLLGSGYSLTPVPLAGSIAGAKEAAQFSSADRVFRYANYAIVSLANALQAWVLEPAVRSEARRKQLGALYAHTALAVSGSLVIALAGPWITSVLFGGELQAARATCIYYAVSFGAMCIATPMIRNILIPRGLTSTVTVSTLLGVGLGVIAMLTLPTFLGVSGVAAALALSDCLTATLIAFAVYRRRDAPLDSKEP